MTRISVVVPAWCEAACVADTVRACSAEADEVVVADADSPDGTAQLAAAAGARVVQAPRGRGSQLRAGAAAATGEVLWFVHADTAVPKASRAAILGSLADPAVGGGNFRVRFGGAGFAGRALTVGYDLQRRWLGTYFGDSAIFVRRDVYEALGGFPDEPLFEDLAFARALDRRGPTRYVRELAVVTSARRFEGAPLRTIALWIALHVCRALGVPPRRVAPRYRAIR